MRPNIYLPFSKKVLLVNVTYFSLSSHSQSHASCRLTDMKKKENLENVFIRVGTGEFSTDSF